MTAQEAALEGLRQKIRSGELRPGARISQKEAADEMGCSIVPVREALKTLEAEGQVVYSPQRGYFVAELDVRELLETYRLRDLLEEEAIRQGIPNIGEDEIDAMREASVDVELATVPGNIQDIMAANRRLHFTLYEASGMPRLVKLIRVLWDLTDRYRTAYNADPRHRERVLAEHRALLDAVVARDADEAVRLQRIHRSNTVASIQDMLGADSDGT